MLLIIWQGLNLDFLENKVSLLKIGLLLWFDPGEHDLGKVKIIFLPRSTCVRISKFQHIPNIFFFAEAFVVLRLGARGHRILSHAQLL